MFRTLFSVLLDHIVTALGKIVHLFDWKCSELNQYDIKFM